jgi:SAGA-associated factor 29
MFSVAISQSICQVVYLYSNLLEVECWSHAAESLRNLSDIYTNPKTVETMGRVNRLIAQWPTDDTVPAEGLTHLQGVQGKLTSGLMEIMNSAKQEDK